MDGINTKARPRKMTIPGNPPITIWDIRHRYPVNHRRTRSLSAIQQIAIHHDGVNFDAGDQDYDGSTVDEDLSRMDADYRSFARFNWYDMAYHMMVSPNGRAYYTRTSTLVGAHVKYHNTPTLGIAGMGDYRFHWPSGVMLFLYAGAAAVVRRGLWRKVPIRGHRDFTRQSTACPGEPTYRQWLPVVDLVLNWADGF